MIVVAVVAPVLAAGAAPAGARVPSVAGPASSATPARAAKASAPSLFDLAAVSIDHVKTPLSRWRGKVILVVNTASECGNTPQYAGLEKLWKEYRARGLVILGFPSNDFDHQEPGSDAEIKTFCNLKYHVTFPMFAKIDVRGAKASPIYKFLSAKDGEPEWNFHKYLVDKDGHVIRAFRPPVEPDDPQLRAAIDAALAK